MFFLQGDNRPLHSDLLVVKQSDGDIVGVLLENLIADQLFHAEPLCFGRANFDLRGKFGVVAELVSLLGRTI
jgi:hypothetical protein